MASEAALRLAQYIVDFEQPSGITDALELAVEDCASTKDAADVLASLFDEVMAGKVQ